MTLKELESYLWGAATYLRGFIDAGDYKQYIFPLLFYKRICDVYDEEYEDALAESDGDLEYAAFDENHRFKAFLAHNGMFNFEQQYLETEELSMKTTVSRCQPRLTGTKCGR